MEYISLGLLQYWGWAVGDLFIRLVLTATGLG